PDTVGYLTQTDSTGRFQLDAIPPGRYVVYALQDQNGNRQRDRREAYDSAIVAVDSTAAATLWAFVHDTLGPRGRGADPIDSITFRVNFTHPCAPAEPPDSARVRVVLLPDSTPVPVAAVLSQARYDSLAMRERAIADSLKRAADTTHKDTTARRDTTPVLARRDTTRPAVPIDTSSLKRLLAQRPVPADHVVIRVAAPLAPNTRYHILVRGVRNLNGATADAQAVLTVPKPAPPPKPAARDSTRA